MVTGATTGLGESLVRDLLAQPEVSAVLAVGREPWEEVDLPPTPRLTYVQTDLRRARLVRELLFGPARQLGVDVLVHGALHRRASDTGAAVHRLNVDCTRLLLRLAEAHPTIRRFVYPSTAAVYQVRADLPDVLREDQPLNLSPDAPQWVRDRVEADVTVCSQLGQGELQVMVLRLSEVLAPQAGSQLFDYLGSMLCLRPLGYDPLVNVLSLTDAVRALRLAALGEATGVVNVPGCDTLPLSLIIRKTGRFDLPLPGPLLGPLYRLRAATWGTDFRYDLNRWRFHYNGVLDGLRARDVLGYQARHPIWFHDTAVR